MVYRGKPSAGCDNCRKAKKRCGLEQPSCLRCCKLRKPCTGYRDTSQLQIQDESEAVRQKIERHKAKRGSSGSQSNFLEPSSTFTSAAPSPTAIPTPSSLNSEYSSGSGSGGMIRYDAYDDPDLALASLSSSEPPFESVTSVTALKLSAFSILQPKPDDIVSNYFFYQFTSPGQWEYVRDIAKQPKLDPCLDLAIKACGMAALTNAQLVPAGKAYAQASYIEALGLLNQALQDPKRSRSDAALVAVSMLGYYENISCQDHQSMMSWKAHTVGATQMLKLRGKAQFKTQTGRILFREIRAQVMVACLWDDKEAPAFLQDFQPELEAQTPDEFHSLWKIADQLTELYYRFAKMRKQLFAQTISFEECFDGAAQLERDLIQWSVDAVAESEFWRYYEVDVEESEHVWDGKVYAYAGNPAPTIWNHWRVLRFMLSRSHEMLTRRLAVSEEAFTEQQAYFRRTRRQMTDEICRTIPACLGHASPAFNSSCVLVTAYASIWSLFFAATSLIERVGPEAWNVLYGLPSRPGKPQSAAYAQLTWIMGRLRYIADDVGLRWANGIAAVLRGEVKIRPRQAPDDPNKPWEKHVPMAQQALWLRGTK